MKISPKETLTLALAAVWVNKFRSALTILGIVIGITTVVTVASLLAGVRKGIVDFFQEFGPDNIFVARVSGDPSGAQARPKELKRKPIRPEYIEYLKATCPAVKDASATLFVSLPPGQFMTAKVPGFESDNVSVSGVTANQNEISPRELQQGRFFVEEEARRGQRVAVLGYSIAEALFPGGDAVGRTVTVNGGEYTVVGVFAQAKGGFFGENGLDRQISIPLETARLRYPLSDNFFLTVQARTGQRTEAFDEVRNALRRLRKTPQGEDDDFAMSTADSIIQNFDRITGMVLLISIGLSGLGLLVGGIGVMNIMLVSVTERTREIGVRKAIGARQRDIILQFLSEAIALTGAGGAVGIVFSILVTLLVGALVPSISAQVPAWAVLAGFSVSVAVGVLFGVWPAVVAARLDPVEALRHE